MFDRKLFLEARARVDIDSLVKDLVVRVGTQFRGQCPLCKASKAKSPNGQFAVKIDQKTWRCFACERFGDVVELEQLLGGGTAVEAARRLVGGEVSSASAETKAEQPKAPSGPSASDKVAAEMLAEMRPFAGSYAEKYLLGRGIAPEVLMVIGPQLGFHPNAKWGWDRDASRWIKAPAMIAPVVVWLDGAAVRTGGVHCTYLAPRGAGKAALDPAKRMWGPQQIEGRHGGAILTPLAVDWPIVAGEGIESSASVMTLDWRRSGTMPCAVAALSLTRLQGGLLRGADGLIDPYDPKPDPARPPFVIPGPWPLARIAVDRDMKPIPVRGRTPRGKPCEFLLGSEARARLCARLASAAWKAAGAIEARAIAPSPGCDFNDELRRVLAAEKRRA
jgi:hypothetical protein